MTFFPRQRAARARATRIAVLAAVILWLGEGFAADAENAPRPPAAVPAYRQANQIAVLTVHDEIDNVTLMSLERRVKQAVEDGADAVVIDLDTPGGEMFAALEICNLLKDRAETPANVVAWVHPTAYSAGAVIALACREIVVAPGSTFGDAAPIAFTPLGGVQSLSPTERAKIESPLLTEMIDSARRNHYDENLVRSFVKLGDGLWMLEHVDTGERIFVDAGEYRAVFGDDPPNLGRAGKTSSAPVPSQTGRVLPALDQIVPVLSDEAGLDPEELKKQQEFEQVLPPIRQPLTEADRGKWKLIRQVVDDSTLLTVRPDEAIFYGLAAAVVANDSELTAFFGSQTIRRYDQTWSESMVRILVSPIVRGLLIVIFLIALFVELAAPGFGVFGITALVSLLILIGAPALVGLAQWWDVLLIAVGLLLVAVELFLLPGLGLAGVAGVLCLLVGLVGSFVSGDITSVQGRNELWAGLLTTLASIFIAGIAIWLISKQLQSIPILNRLVLRTELRDESGEDGSGTTATGLLEAMGAAQRALKPGDTGYAETDLRPAGRANIHGRLVDVKSAGSYIEKGRSIRVLSVGRFAIEVEECS